MSEANYNPGPDGVGRLAGNEIVLYRWPQYEMARVVTTEQIYRIIRHSDIESTLTIGQIDTIDRGAAFVLRELGGPTPQNVALIVVEDRSTVNPHWAHRSKSPGQGMDRFSVHSVHVTPDGLSKRQTSLIATFLFDWIGLNPQRVLALPRLKLQLPFGTIMPDTDMYNYEMEHPEMVVGTPLFIKWTNGVMSTWIQGLSGKTPYRVVSRGSNRLEVASQWTKISLFWEIEGGQRIVWKAGWVPGYFGGRSGWKNTPSEAVAEIDIVCDIDGLNDWLDAHFEKGEPQISDDYMELFYLLDEDPPSLWPADKMLAYLEDIDFKMPWE